MASKSTSFNGNKLVTVKAAKQSMPVTIGASGVGQTLTVKIGSTTYKSGDVVSADYGTAWSASVTPSEGYNAGAISPSTSGTITGPLNITVAPATKKEYKITLNEHSNASVKITASVATSEGKTSVTDANMNGVYYGTAIGVEVTPNAGYRVSSITID